MTAIPATPGGPLRVFVSYSHDSPEHAQRVLALSDRLRAQGIDCQLDQYEMSPPEGWPAWMNVQIKSALFVLVVCTEVYARRVSGQEEPGRGLGARWEGAIITQALYDSGGRNDKFIPIVFAESDIAFIPTFLRAVTRYDLGTPNGYQALYRHLTNQPRVIKPPLGSVEVLPPIEHDASETPKPVAANDLPDRALLMSFGGEGTFFIPLEEAAAADTIVLSVAPASPQQSAFLESLRRSRDSEVGVAFGLSAFLGKLKAAKQQYGDGKERWLLTFVADEADYGAGLMEMSTSGYSADDIATLRARRILLNETRAINDSDTVGLLNDTTLEVLIRGMNTPLQVTASPLPALFADAGGDRNAFIQAARLLLVMYLRLAGVVERVFTLELAFESADRLRVDFEGQRVKKYTNVPAPQVSVHGICVLR